MKTSLILALLTVSVTSFAGNTSVLECAGEAASFSGQVRIVTQEDGVKFASVIVSIVSERKMDDVVDLVTALDLYRDQAEAKNASTIAFSNEDISEQTQKVQIEIDSNAQGLNSKLVVDGASYLSRCEVVK